MDHEDLSFLNPGESVSNELGERTGRSRGGWAVRLRRRTTETGFVVTTDAPLSQDETSEMITTEWATANATFDRLMKDH